jgi:hypothetical protein
MDKINGASLNVGKFTLTYHLEDGKLFTLTVDKNTNRTAEVAYDVAKWNDGSNSYESIPPNSSFAVHTHKNSGGLPNFIPVSQFLNNKNNVSENFMVIHDGYSAPDYAGLKPKFAIEPDAGFSFLYDKAEIHFLWNASDNTFCFVTNQAVTGRVYDFNLEFAYPGDSPLTEGTARVLTGISKTTFRAIPFANGSPANPEGFTQGRDDGSTFAYDADLKQYEHVLNMASEPEDTHPGSPENELVLRFDVPKEYNPSTRRFEFPISKSGEMTAAINLDHINDKLSAQINLVDIYKRAYEVIGDNASIRTTGGYYIKNADKVPGIEGRYEVRIGGMLPGILFSQTKISARDSSGVIKSSASSIPLGQVFTFLDYEAVNQNGKFYALVRPYEGYSGYYMLKSADPLQPAVTQYSNGTAPILLPLTINADNLRTEYYQIFFSPLKDFDGNLTAGSVYSQILRFKADSGNLTVEIPGNFEITSHTLYPAESEPDAASEGELGLLDFTVRWDLGDAATISALVENSPNKELVLVYRLSKSLTPNNPDPAPFDDIVIKITSQSGLMAQYSDDRSSYASKWPLIVSESKPLESRSESAGGIPRYTYFVEASFAEIPSALSTSEKVPPGSPIEFYYPNIYFMNVAPVSINGLAADIAASLFDSMTLSDLSNIKVPPPQSFKAGNPITTSDPDEVSFEVSYILPGAKISDFIRSQNPNLQHFLSMNLYISQDERYMRDEFMLHELPERIGDSVLVPYLESYGDTLFFSDIGGKEAMSGAVGYDEPIEALRSGKVVRVGDIKLTQEYLEALLQDEISIGMLFKLDGMDKNQKYYLCADIVVTSQTATKSRSKASEFSSLAVVTTPDDKQKPDSSEQMPPSPELSKKNVGLSSATLCWYRIAPMSDDDRIEYEIIRIKGRQIEPSLMDSKIQFETWFDKALAGFEKAGWRTDGDRIESYGVSGWELAPETSAKYSPVIIPTEFTDYSLLPNEVYFYYIRAVRIVADLRIVSGWSGISLTTTPVQSPKNLRAELARADYNPKTEIIISFDAPIVDLSLLGSEYNFQYQIKEGSGEWDLPKTMTPAAIISSSSPEAGYTKLYYKISGLKNASLYTIHVRMTDSAGGASVYCKEIQVKTDIDQASYDNLSETNEWVNYLRNKLYELLKAPFWATKDNGRQFEAIYREDMLEGLISSSVDGLIPLAAGSGAISSFYLPAAHIIRANESGKGFRISRDDMDVILTANALDIDGNNAAASLWHQMKMNNIEDFYIKVTVEWFSQGSSESGSLTKTAGVSLTAVGSLEPIREWNAEMLEAASAAIERDLNNPNLLEFIASKVEAGMLPEEFVRAMDKLELASKDTLRHISTGKIKPVLRYAYPVSRLDAPIIITVKNLDAAASVSAYRFIDKRWDEIEVLETSGGRSVSVKKPGLYQFHSRRVKPPGIELYENSGGISEIAATYRLEDFFGKGKKFNLIKNITRRQLASSTARILGAPESAEPFSWLKSRKGISLSARSPASNAAWQEAVYATIGIYSSMTGAAPDSLQKKDYEGFKAIKGLDEKFKPSIFAAYELGIVLEPKHNAGDPVTLMEFLQMLKGLDDRIGL